MARSTKNSRTLTSELIAAEALQLADEEGLGKLTVRRLATRIGIGTMTFYGYFRSKEKILDAMADLALGSLELPAAPADGERPSESITIVANAFRTLMHDHPSVVQILSSRVTESPRARRGAMESVIDRLIASGIPGPLAVRCYGFIVVYSLGFTSYQAPRSWADEESTDQEELRRQQSHRYAALSTTEFPRLVSLRDSIIDLPSPSQFAFGIECLTAQVQREIAD